jgi:hypothetical protein
VALAQPVLKDFERRTDKLARQAGDHHLILVRGGLYPRRQIGRFINTGNRPILFRTGRFKTADSARPRTMFAGSD